MSKHLPGTQTSSCRVLVVGATGMLGHMAVRVLRSRFDVEATVRQTSVLDPSPSVGVPLHRLDALAGPSSIEKVLDTAQPDVVLNCVGVVKQLREASDPVLTIAINSLFPHQLATACRRRNLRLIHISTDCVFSGRLKVPAGYVEDDEPDPLDLYGRSKLLGEATGRAVLTLRTSIIGPEVERSSGLLAWLQSQAGRHVQGYLNSHFSGLTTYALATLLGDLISAGTPLSGLYHISAEPISKFSLISQLNEYLELGCFIEAVAEPRINRVLDSSRLRSEADLAIPSWTTMLTQLAERHMHDGQS